MIWKFKYLNHRGEIAERRIIPDAVELQVHGSYGYQPGWFISGMCLDRRARRSFALSRIVIDDHEPSRAVLATFPIPEEFKS